MLEMHIFLNLGICIGGRREITAVDVGAAEGIANAVLPVEIGFDDLFLLLLREFGKGFRRSISQRAAEAEASSDPA
jgi:hypothetical protein